MYFWMIKVWDLIFDLAVRVVGAFYFLTSKGCVVSVGNDDLYSSSPTTFASSFLLFCAGIDIADFTNLGPGVYFFALKASYWA